MDLFLKYEYLKLCEKVDFQMTALDDLKASYAELEAVVTHTVTAISGISGKLDLMAQFDADVAKVASDLRALKDTLVENVGVPTNAPAVVLPDTAIPAVPPAPIVDPVTNVVRG